MDTYMNNEVLSPRPWPVSERSFAAAYADLRRAIVSAGLLNRAYAYYGLRSALSFAFLIVALTLPFLLPVSPLALALEALALGFASIQVAMIGHDAGHLAVLGTTRANWMLGFMCWSFAAGIGFWWWYDRHNAHHGHTNDLEEDPDIQWAGMVAITEEQAVRSRGWRRMIALFVPVLVVVLLVIALFFRFESWRYALTQLRGRRRVLEITLLTCNAGLWVLAISHFGWHWLAFFVAGQAVAGTYLGMVVAPNHKGMPVWTKGAQLSFLERQVLSSRNVTPHPVWDFLFGGLNYQIEHHLFPTMPRVHLGRARQLIKPFCIAQGLGYEEMGPLMSYRKVFEQGIRVSQAARRPVVDLDVWV
jgi:fatty acid desaturase